MSRDMSATHSDQLGDTEARDTVETWADGFGVWHARILCASHGYGNAGEYALDRHWTRLRAMARRAIRRELELRDAIVKPGRGSTDPAWRLNLEIVKVSEYASSGVIYALEFKERD